jgi:hypothetical protein
MIQEHLSLKRLQKIYSENQELGNLNRFPVKRAFLQGNYYGISVLERSTISGVSGNKTGFDSSARYFEITTLWKCM